MAAFYFQNTAMALLELAADDILIIAEKEHALDTIMPKLYGRSRVYGLEITEGKTKVIIVDQLNSDNPDMARVAVYETVRRFDYLGEIVSNTRDFEQDIPSASRWWGGRLPKSSIFEKRFNSHSRDDVLLSIEN